MPITKSAHKALRQNQTRRKRNIAYMKVLKGELKRFTTTPTAEALPGVYKRLDKAAKTNLIKKNKANRLKSRLSKRLAPKVTP